MPHPLVEQIRLKHAVAQLPDDAEIQRLAKAYADAVDAETQAVHAAPRDPQKIVATTTACCEAHRCLNSALMARENAGKPLSAEGRRAALALSREAAGEVLAACDRLLAGERAPLSREAVAGIRALAADRVDGHETTAAVAMAQGQRWRDEQLAMRGITG